MKFLAYLGVFKNNFEIRQNLSVFKGNPQGSEDFDSERWKHSCTELVMMKVTFIIMVVSWSMSQWLSKRL